MAVYPARIPRDDIPLTPTHAFYIIHQKHQIQIFSLTSSISSLYSHEKGPNLQAANELIHHDESRPVPVYTLKKGNLFGTHLTARDFEGKEVAEWNHPIWTLHAGKTIIKFSGVAEDGKLEGEEVMVQLAGSGRKAESFVHANTTFVWEIEPHYHTHKTLYRIIDLPAPAQPPEQQKRLIADFSQVSSNVFDGLLVVDAREIEDLVGILTLCAVLEGPAKEETSDVLGSMAFAGLMG
jgi:hypothetical protein